MTLPLRVLGDRVLVKPDVNTNAPEQTEGGVYLATSLAAAVTGEDATLSLCRGTVVAVGTPRHPLHHEAMSLAARLDSHTMQIRPAEELALADDAAAMLRDVVRKQPAVVVGDDVLYSHDAGQETTVAGDVYVILREHELLAVVEPEPVGVV